MFFIVVRTPVERMWNLWCNLIVCVILTQSPVIQNSDCKLLFHGFLYFENVRWMLQTV